MHKKRNIMREQILNMHINYRRKILTTVYLNRHLGTNYFLYKSRMDHMDAILALHTEL